jgi:hypothetical protein
MTAGGIGKGLFCTLIPFNMGLKEILDYLGSVLLFKSTILPVHISAPRNSNGGRSSRMSPVNLFELIE